MNFSGSNFVTSALIIQDEKFYYSINSPFFDEAQVDNRVIVRSFKQSENVALYDSQHAPVYNLPLDRYENLKSEFMIDFSIIQRLDEDIVNIIGSLQEFNGYIGDAEVMFSYDYKKLIQIRKSYFKRLTDKINLKEFFNFYTWFDTNLGTFIKQLIPARNQFNKINFVIESHILERPKFNYAYYDIYLDEADRETGRLNSKQEIINNIDDEGNFAVE